MSQSKKIVSAEELRNAHRSSSPELKRAKRVQEGIRQSGLIKRGVAKVKGKTADARRGVEEAQKAYDVALQVPKERIDAIQGRVNEV